MGISTHALAGQLPPNTLRIQGIANTRPLTILIDSCSTHSFLDPKVARDVGSDLVSIPLMKVLVANDSKLDCNFKCPQFKWIMQVHKFQYDMRLRPLGGYDVMLGVDWMKQYNSVTMDFNKLRLVFEKDGKMTDLKGNKERSTGTI